MSRLQLNFNGGEIDPDERERIDLQLYDTGLTRAENVISRPHGGVSRRGGFRHFARLGHVLAPADITAATVTMPNGGDAAALQSGGDWSTTTNMPPDDLYVVAEIDFGADVTLAALDIDLAYLDDGTPGAGGDGGSGGGGSTVGGGGQPDDPPDTPDTPGGGREDDSILEQY